MTIEDTPEVMQEVLKKMFSVIGKSTDGFDFSDGWYSQHSWTKAQEDEFAEWLTTRLKERKFLNEFVRFPALCTNKKGRKRCVSEFLLMWGWKRSEKEEI